MDKYTMSSSPHVRSAETTGRIMRDVLIALLPATACGVYLFGWNALMVVLVGVAAAVATEAALQALMKRRVTAADGSAAVTGLLLALNLPPSVPFWIPMIGSAFAIAIVKQCFGGLGYNFINPALAARAFLVVSWTPLMTAWSAPIRTIGAASVDALSSATPLGLLKAGTPLAGGYLDMALGNTGGCIGETSAIALLLGGLYLIARRVINWRIPAVYIATVAALTWIAGPEGLFTGDALYHILGGGLMIGAIFMATDYVTSPMSGRGKIVFALGCGILTSVIRLWGGYAEGVSYSILLMNLAVPLLDRAFRPKVFGVAAVKEAAK
jgi:electron transport complex protein RnfD